jgi:hypothetical protein
MADLDRRSLELRNRTTPARGGLLSVALLLLAVATCQTGGGTALAFPSGTIDRRATTLAPPGSQPWQLTLAASSKNNGKRSQNSGKRYFIEFRSRYALSYGHSFVIFGRMSKSGKMINPEVAGLHPASDSVIPYMLGHIIPVPAETGWSDGDLEDEYRSAYWRVMLTEPEYKKAVANIRRIQASSPVWHAGVYNCNAFVASIARSMGYRTPNILLRPQQFMTRLREMNGGPNAIGSTGPPG